VFIVATSNNLAASRPRRSLILLRSPLPAKVSPAQKSSRPSSPDSTRRLPKSSSSPPRLCWLSSAARNLSRSPATKISRGCVPGLTTAPFPPIEVLNPVSLFSPALLNLFKVGQQAVCPVRILGQVAFYFSSSVESVCC